MSRKNKANREGILSLADDLIKHARLYNQEVYGNIEPCGTVRCMAGQCLANEIGSKEFIKRVKAGESLWPDAVEAGKRQLGLSLAKHKHPLIFLDHYSWPNDLTHEYNEAKTNIGKVIAALKALSRLRIDGTISSMVQTRIPQLTALLKDQKAPAKKGRK